MHRRNFVVRCGVAAAGTLLLPILPLFAGGSLRAADVAASGSVQMTRGDRVLLKLLSAYGADVYFWGGGVFARATGLKTGAATVDLLVRVNDFLRLAAFVRSDAFKALGKVRSEGSTLSFNFKGTSYTVTNAGGADFSRAVAGGGVSKGRVADGTAAGALLLSPLVSGSLKSEFGLDAAVVVAQVEKLRAEVASGDFSDAALWLAAILAGPIKDGTAGEWLDLATDDAVANASNSAALAVAKRLVLVSNADARWKRAGVIPFLGVHPSSTLGRARAVVPHLVCGGPDKVGHDGACPSRCDDGSTPRNSIAAVSS